jgi:hypothetical protein
MHLKIFVKLKKKPKIHLVWAKNPKKPKKPTGLFFFFKPGFFLTLFIPDPGWVRRGSEWCGVAQNGAAL